MGRSYVYPGSLCPPGALERFSGQYVPTENTTKRELALAHVYRQMSSSLSKRNTIISSVVLEQFE